MSVAQGIKVTEGARPKGEGQLLLGEDWVSPDALAEQELRAGRGRRGLVALNSSPLARKIVLFNMLAIVVMVLGVVATQLALACCWFGLDLNDAPMLLPALCRPT